MTGQCICNYCGKELHVKTVETPFGVIAQSVEQCDCEGARRERAQQKAIAERKALSEATKVYERAGITPRYINAQSKKYPWQKGLYLHGAVGTGKTYTASAICKQAIDEDAKHVHFVSGAQLLAEIRQTFSGETKESQVYAKYGERCELLIIDDLGKENPTDFALSVIFNVINTRYDYMLPTIITSQYSIPELINRLASKGDPETAQAIGSRLAEMCPRRELSGKDRRLA